MNVYERHGYYFEDLKVGMEATFAKSLTGDDIDTFAALSGDHNPIHLDEAFAARSIFTERIAHGLLTASFISTVLGMKLPGPGCIYVSQSLNFRAPVHIGDEILAKVRIQDLIKERSRAIFECDCTVNGQTVLDGEAVLMVPSRT
ncbi:MAG: MaoC family dehydratase [Methyloligellaceae bacterium]